METAIKNAIHPDGILARIGTYFAALKDTKSKEFLTTYKWLCVEILFLISLGGAVRAMNAGLACPDWPLCFGDFIPDYHPQVYLEFLHRVLAGFIALVSTYLNYRIMRSAEASRITKFVAGAIIVLLFAQIIMGGLTVLLQLHEYVVAAHLGLGTMFFAMSFWIYLTIKSMNSFKADNTHADMANSEIESRTEKAGRVLIALATAQVVFVFTQIMLGGLVASHYAAQVCTEFPLCHGQWVPTLDGIIGLHVIHRLGAYVLTAITIAFVCYLVFRVKNKTLSRGAYALGTLLSVQIVIGIANVILLTPPLITVMHLLVGTMTLGASVYILRMSSLVSLRRSA